MFIEIIATIQLIISVLILCVIVNAFQEQPIEPIQKKLGERCIRDKNNWSFCR